MKNKIRIIGGQWRSRQIRFEDVPGLRPTPDRVRETLFNWIQNDIIDSRCLDLYSGSGALGFEAASRGAKAVVQVEINPVACRNLKANAEALAAHQVKLVTMDVRRFLDGNAEAYDLVFLDPPFTLDLTIPTCRLLEEHNWLMPSAKIYLECAKGVDLTGIPINWALMKDKTAGEVEYRLYRRMS